MEAGDERRSEEAKKRVVIHAISTVAVLVIAVGLTAVSSLSAGAAAAAAGILVAAMTALLHDRRGRRQGEGW